MTDERYDIQSTGWLYYVCREASRCRWLKISDRERTARTFFSHENIDVLIKLLANGVRIRESYSTLNYDS